MIKNQVIDFNGISVATKDSGSGKDAIIFIHGSCMNSDAWLPQLKSDALRKKYRLIAFDLPGNGQSGRYQNDPTNYRPGKIALFVSVVFRSLSTPLQLAIRPKSPVGPPMMALYAWLL